MTDTYKLRCYIIKSGLTLKRIAKLMGITYYSLQKKMNNTVEFKASEIAELSKILRIHDPKDIQTIFFTKSSDLKSPNWFKQEEWKMSENDILYTVSEVSKLIKCNNAYTYRLINAGLLPVLKLGCYKIRKTALLDFLAKYEGKDLSDPKEIRDIAI